MVINTTLNFANNLNFINKPAIKSNYSSFSLNKLQKDTVSFSGINKQNSLNKVNFSEINSKDISGIVADFRNELIELSKNEKLTQIEVAKVVEKITPNLPIFVKDKADYCNTNFNKDNYKAFLTFFTDKETKKIVKLDINADFELAENKNIKIQSYIISDITHEFTHALQYLDKEHEKNYKLNAERNISNEVNQAYLNFEYGIGEKTFIKFENKPINEISDEELFDNIPERYNSKEKLNNLFEEKFAPVLKNCSYKMQTVKSFLLRSNDEKQAWSEGAKARRLALHELSSNIYTKILKKEPPDLKNQHEEVDLTPLVYEKLSSYLEDKISLLKKTK